MSSPADLVSENLREKLKKADFPRFQAPMLATLSHEVFSRRGWIFERKLDGVRCLACKDGDAVRLYSRNAKELNDTYPELEEAVAGLKVGTMVADGEIVTFEGKITSFSRLQGRSKIKDRKEARESGIPVYLYLFDIPFLEGWDLAGLPLRARKSVLRRALSFKNPLRYTPHRNEEGEDYHREACRKGWEGIIAKDAESRYRHSRSPDWLKFRCSLRQELVIGGFTEPAGERSGFGALLVGYYEGDELRYAGKVGTGYDHEFLTSFRQTLGKAERRTPPFSNGDLPQKDVHWVSPKFIGEFAFTEWTDDNRLRHPRFLGLREDKDPEEVVRE